jgi:hypothetical protein
MLLIFKDFKKNEVINEKEIDVGAHIPNSHDSVTLANGKNCLVIGVNYFLSTKSNELYEKIEVLLEVFEKEKK